MVQQMYRISEDRCDCRGELVSVDSSGASLTVQCRKCGYAELHLRREYHCVSIPLARFHLTRGNGPGLRPVEDLTMAQNLVDALCLDVWPSPATIVDFGIASERHYGVLQHAVGCGITAYELDRVIGDGTAITRLVRSTLGRQYTDVLFVTSYDGLSLED